MRPALLLSLALSLPLGAQSMSFGEAFPVADLRYEMLSGTPRLVSNGRHLTMFWSTDHRVRATPLAQNERMGSYAVVDVAPGIGGSFDVAWTGDHYLVVATRYGPPDTIVGRLVAANGQPIGSQFIIVAGARHPRIAFSGTSAMLLYEPTPTSDVHALMLDAQGVRTGEPRRVGQRFGALSALAGSGDTFAAAIAYGPHLHLLIFDRNGATRSEQAILSSGGVALASDGRRYLLVTVEEHATNAYARILDPNGALGTALALEPPALEFFRAPSAAWTGTGWVVAYTNYPGDGEFRVVHLDANAQSVQRRERHGGNDAAIGVDGGRAVFAYLPHLDFSDVIHIEEKPVSIAPAAQILGDAASSSDATLVVWHEGRSLRAGIRRSDGRWSERVIWPGAAFQVAAASDGRDFAVLFSTSDGMLVLHLDANGEAVGAPIPVTGMFPRDILWSGREYLLVGNQSGLVVARLGQAPAKVLNTGGLEHLLVSNGDGFYAAWITVGPRGDHDPYFPPGGVAGIRLGADFQPLDAAPFTFVTNDLIADLAATWDGQRYVVAWKEKEGVVAATVPAAPNATPTIRTIAREDQAMNLAAEAGTIVWINNGALRFASASGAPVTIGRNVSTTAPLSVVSLSGGRTAIVRSSLENQPPLEGASRIMMTIAGPALLPRPEAPRASGELRGNALTLAWTMPPQPVSGYRVEARYGIGPWIELASLSPEVRSFSATVPAVPIMFRVKAWNEAGGGEYSQVVPTNLPRRRATR